MTAALRRRALRAMLIALAVGACGPYAQLAQKLDVTARIAGDTWIAAVGPDKAEIRIIVVGKPDLNGSAPFSFSSIAGPIVTTLQGSWTEAGAAGATTLRVAHSYRLDQNGGVGGPGAQRNDSPFTLQVTVSRAGGQLAVSGHPALSGTYVGLAESLARFATMSARDAPTCAFEVADLAVQTSEARIIGFGSAAMTQYTSGESFVGTIAGSVHVGVSLGLNGASTRIGYGGFSDQGGVMIDGEQVTDSSLSGNGSMSGTVAFTFAPVAPDPATVSTITGAIDYGSVQILGGSTGGGYYVVSVDPMGASTVGATDQVAAVGALSPSVAECLALP